MPRSIKKITDKCRRIYKTIEQLENSGALATMQTIAHHAGYDIARDIDHEINFLVRQGYLKKLGKPHTTSRYVKIIKPLFEF